MGTSVQHRDGNKGRPSCCYSHGKAQGILWDVSQEALLTVLSPQRPHSLQGSLISELKAGMLQ